MHFSPDRYWPAGFPNAPGRTLVDQRSARLTAPRPELHHPIPRLHRGRVVLDDHDRIPGIREPPQQAEQALRVRRVESDGRLVQHV